MAQFFLGMMVILGGIALAVTELTGGRRTRERVEREFADLRKLMALKPDRDELEGQITALREVLDNEVGVIRAGLASVQVEIRKIVVAEQSKGLEHLGADLREEFGRTRQEAFQQLDAVTDKLEGLRDELGRTRQGVLRQLEEVRTQADTTDQTARRALAEVNSRLTQHGKRQDARLAALESASRGTVRGMIHCTDPDIGVAVEDVLLRLSEAAGLRLASKRVSRSSPLEARYWFAGIDGPELEDWFRHAVQVGDPKVEALFEVLAAMTSGAVSVGPMTLLPGSDRWRPYFLGEDADHPA